MNTYNKASYQEIENEFIPLSDGRNLAARIWLPLDADKVPVPAILEYLPYRKRDGTALRDESTYSHFATAGYAGVRVDISGTGESDGDYNDEYSPRELADALEVIEWVAAQDWCDGNLGMMGISWGGFNSLQVAALRPAALKAVISIGSTVDRYNNDIHYKNGCQLYSNFQWSSTMLCFASRPPDPLLIGSRWREMWLHRLNTQPFPLETWLTHQRRDDYWKHGSICEDYRAIQVPAMLISGWADGYINAPPAMAANNQSLVKAINGPWIHKYPHFAWPRPRMDFIGEALTWWDRWLKGIENNVENIPAYRAYLSEAVKPNGDRKDEAGHWVGEQTWPSNNVAPQTLHPCADGELLENSRDEASISICSPQDCGVACGEFFPLKPDSEMSGDQRVDDAGSLVFETAPLENACDILGRPTLNITVAIDQPIGNLIARLIDVHPDSTSHRVSWGTLNLAHRNNNEHPESMTPGQAEEVSIQLDECGYRFLPGHKIKLAISTAYWPMIMPPPAATTATITLGTNTQLQLPILKQDNAIEIKQPNDPNPLPDYRCHQPPTYQRNVKKDLDTNLTHFRVFDDTGEYSTDGHGMRSRHTHEECWTISSVDPLTSVATSTYISYLARGDWSVKTISESSLRCDAEHFYLEASITAWEGKQQTNQRTWQKTILRDFL